MNTVTTIIIAEGLPLSLSSSSSSTSSKEPAGSELRGWLDDEQLTHCSNWRPAQNLLRPEKMYFYCVSGEVVNSWPLQ